MYSLHYYSMTACCKARCTPIMLYMTKNIIIIENYACYAPAQGAVGGAAVAVQHYAVYQL